LDLQDFQRIELFTKPANPKSIHFKNNPVIQKTSEAIS